MADLFQASEILEVAISIEENGEAFYREIAGKRKDAVSAGFFRKLADDEVRHSAIFSKMLNDRGKYEPESESYVGEYAAYLRAFADHHVFNKENAGHGAASRMRSMKEILNFAIRIELESIVFYMDLKQDVFKEHGETINKIIDEERGHYNLLSELENHVEKPRVGRAEV
jgi:rubrerythrin